MIEETNSPTTYHSPVIGTAKNNSDKTVKELVEAKLAQAIQNYKEAKRGKELLDKITIVSLMGLLLTEPVCDIIKINKFIFFGISNTALLTSLLLRQQTFQRYLSGTALVQAYQDLLKERELQPMLNQRVNERDSEVALASIEQIFCQIVIRRNNQP